MTIKQFINLVDRQFFFRVSLAEITSLPADMLCLLIFANRFNLDQAQQKGS